MRRGVYNTLMLDTLMVDCTSLPRYRLDRTFDWNYEHAPEPIAVEVPKTPGDWRFCGLPVESPLGIPAGPLLNGRWCLYYASLGFDVLTYKTVRSRHRPCYELPNLVPVDCDQLQGGEAGLPASNSMLGSWAVSYGMPSKSPDNWRADIEATRIKLPPDKLLSVSVVASVDEDWTIDDLADDYARCAKWAIDSGADTVETNFSCPNVSTFDGQLYQNPTDAKLVAEHVRDLIGDTPFIVKIGRVSSRKATVELLNAIGGIVDALAMTNSIATTVHSQDGRLFFDGQRRGICGQAIRKASTSQVRMFSELIRECNLSLKLIGVGGACSASDVGNYLDAGAGAVHMATAAMTNPALAIEIKRELATD